MPKIIKDTATENISVNENNLLGGVIHLLFNLYIANKAIANGIPSSIRSYFIPTFLVETKFAFMPVVWWNLDRHIYSY